MRFYEPLLLLLAATQACMHNLAPRIPEPSPGTWNQTEEQLFHDFMNKLAQICDNRKGGPTVTAVVALSYPDRVQYRFASNQRSEQDLEQMKKFVIDILETLREWTEEQSLLVKMRVLRKVVAFTRPRLRGYVEAVASYSVVCLKSEDLAPGVVQKLEALQQISSAANGPDLDENACESELRNLLWPTVQDEKLISQVFLNCAKLMELIQKITRSRSSTYKTFRNRANSNLAGQTNPWAEMRHAAGRLLSYYEGVETLIEAREQPEWAQLFYDFEIVCVASSEPHPNPIVGPRKSVGAADILGRMTASLDQSKLATFTAGANDLQRFGLDDNIRKQTSNKSFRPIVHAEVLLHSSIRDVEDLRYFGGWRYIGASKPTCRLCEYYFQAVFRITGDQVHVRKSHRNLYINWRAPDANGHKAGTPDQREKILNDMILYVRQDTFQTLRDKTGERKRYDSNTSRTYIRKGFDLEVSSVSEDDLDEISSMMGGASLDD